MAVRSRRDADRKKKLHRLISILRNLDIRKQCTPETLAEEFGTTERNIYRDLKDLDAAGFSITFDREDNTYRFTDPDFSLRDLNLNSDELTALLVGQQLSHNLGKHFEKAFQSLLKKVHKDTGAKTRAIAKDMNKGKQFFIDISPMEGFEHIERQYNALVEAMDRKEEIEIVYKAMRSRQETKRVIAPYGLSFHEGMWYVVGYCHMRREIRTFALDCIKAFEVTSRPYSIPSDFKIAEYFKPGWHMIRYGEPVEVVIKFEERYARWIKRRTWHPTQVIEEDKDGSHNFKDRIEGTRELKWWTYHWIPYCEIMAPLELRDEVMREMKEMLKRYGNAG